MRTDTANTASPEAPDPDVEPVDDDLLASRLARKARLLLAGNMAVLMTLVAAAFILLMASREAYEARARDATENVASSLSGAIAGDLKLIDNALQSVALQIERTDALRAAPDTINTLMAEQRTLVPMLERIRIADERGLVRYGLLPTDPQDVNVSDRSYYKEAREAFNELIVSEPLQSRITRQWVVVLARRLQHRNGNFAGVVYANVEAAQFAKILNRVAVGRDGAVSLRTGHRMALLARYAPDADRVTPVGSTNISAELARALSRSPISGYYVTTTALDQIERGTAYQRVGSYPLTVLVGLSTDHFLAGWRRQAWEVCGLLVTIAVTVACFSVLMFRAARRELVQQQRISRLAAMQSAMLDNELVAISRVRDRHTIWKNRAMERIFGYDPGELDGTPTRILFVDDASYDLLGAQAYPILHAGGHYRTQMQMRRKDGTPVWVDANSVQLSDGESMWMMVDITAMKEREAEVSHLAFHDVLTGLLNRALLPQRLNQILIAAGRSGQRVAVCYLDLDGFKAVNDQHGHDAGDELLLEVAARLKASVRSHDIVARMGGDEFVIVLASVADSGEARHALERLLTRLQEPITLRSSTQVSVGASIGIALAPEHGQDSATLVAKADQAMLDAKRAGKNRITLHGDEGTPTAPREAAPIG